MRDRSEAFRHIDLVLDEKVKRLRELLKQVEEDISREQEKGVEDASEQLPHIPNPADVPREERSIRGIRANIHDVESWRERFFGIFDTYFIHWDEPKF